MTRETEYGSENRHKPFGLVWVDSPYPLVATGLSRILESKAWVHVGHEPPEAEPSMVIFGVGGVEGLLEGIRRIRRQSPGASILVCSLYLELKTAQAALRAGARGYIHAGMQPEQIVRALEVILEGEIVAPRQLLEYLISSEVVDLGILSARQREILHLVDDGLSNAQIARQLFLSESTIKQHLRAAYKALGVKNRTEAARLVRNGD